MTSDTTRFLVNGGDALAARHLPPVSVVIPVWNGERYLKRAIDSALAQTHPKVEVIVIDDGSTDGSKRILEGYRERIVWESQSKRGQAAALNRGVRRASSEYVALLDADDECLPGRCAAQVRRLEAEPSAALVYAGRMVIDQEGLMREAVTAEPTDPLVLLQHNHITRSSVMLRKASWAAVGGFDELNSGNDDWDMWVRLSERFPLAYIPDPLIRYRVHPANISTTRPNKLDFYRWTRLRMLEAASSRRGSPWWLSLMVRRAQVEHLVGRAPGIGERFPTAWWRLGKALSILERVIIRHIAHVSR